MKRLITACLVGTFALGCDTQTLTTAAGPPGDPLIGLSPEQIARFEAGRALFDKDFSPEEGLGPLFNDRRCSSCHDLPAIGGTGVEPAVKATRFDPSGSCDLLQAEGGDNVQSRVTPLLRDAGITREENPPSATARTSLMPPSLFGLGLVEAIPADVIRTREDPDDSDGDGISGRAVVLEDGSLGRFGRKGGVPTVSDFIETALRFEMGLTTPDHPAEEPINGKPIPDGTDPAPDPEISGEGIALLDDFVRFLAPPEREQFGPAARDTVRLGQRLFGEVGCPSCHVPAMQTATSADPAFDRKTVALFSDLLLHDMGPGLADICTPDAAPSEYRTARLMGLRFRVDYLHDGRAGSPRQAILMHGGEAGGARDGFIGLSPSEQTALLRYIATL